MLLQDEGFIRVIEGAEWKADLGSQIHVCLDDLHVHC